MTSDEPALIDAIIANRDDDTPRLAYADWLEENAGMVAWNCRQMCGNQHDDRCELAGGTGRISDGRRERAEFIHVQCELARNYPYEDKSWCDSNPAIDTIIERGLNHYRELRRRERELLSDENKAAWFGSTYFNRISASYSRGFVSAIACSWADWHAHADAILRAQPIERVKLTTRPEILFTPDPGREYVQTARFADSTTSYRFNLARIRPVNGEEPLVEAARDEPLGNWMVREMLARRWPRIEFELPPAQTNSATWQFNLNLDLAAAENL